MHVPLIIMPQVQVQPLLNWNMTGLMLFLPGLLLLILQCLTMMPLLQALPPSLVMLLDLIWLLTSLFICCSIIRALLTSLSMVCWHHIVLYPRLPKTATLTASLSSFDSHKSRVVFNLVHEPLIISNADRYEDWRDAIKAEIQVLCSNGTWFVVCFHHSTNVVGCHWVYKIKRCADGSIERYEAQLVAKGFS